VRSRELAATYGTPLLVIDTMVLDANLTRFADLGSKHDIDVTYAGKALLLIALAERIGRTPLGLDVCSLGELTIAERAGVPANRIAFHGCGKTDEELQAALDGRVGRIVVDNREELDRLISLANAEHTLSILLRMNVGIEAHTHDYVRTGGEGSKFGFAPDALEATIAAILAAPGLQFVGFHSHIGSQIFEAESFCANVRELLGLVARARALGCEVGEVIAGGGFGVGAHPNDQPLDLESTIAAMQQALTQEAQRLRVPVPQLGIEPGRAIIADAGTSLYRVVAVKRIGSRRYAIVDGGLADNPRPLLYDAYHHPELAAREDGTLSTAPLIDTTLCGRSCENDEFVTAPLPEDLRAGDLLAIYTTGAYTYSMASNYNRFPRPAVVFAGNGRHRLVARRETLEDLLRVDVPD
jgi:diaminopimelate decarboxylase